MSTVLPTLTKDGFIDHIPTLLLKLYEYFLLTDYSQSVCFYRSLSSLKYLIQKHKENIDELTGEVQQTLYNLVDRYLSNIDKQVSDLNVIVDTVDNDDNNFIFLVIDVSVIVDGVSYDLKRELEVNTTSFTYKDSRLNYLITGE